MEKIPSINDQTKEGIIKEKYLNDDVIDPLLKQQIDHSQLLRSKIVADIGNVASPDRLQLLDIYHKIVVDHLEYALNNKIDQELWNTIYKQSIAHFQAQIRDVKNSRMAEAQVTLGLLVDQGIGYYISLLSAICQKYSVSLPCRRPLSSMKIPIPNHLMNKVNDNIKLASRSNKSNLHSKLMKSATNSHTEKIKGVNKRPHLTSIESIVEHCLVHLGDLARYVHHPDHAANYYMWAVRLAAGTRGHPFNQLAILEDGKSNKMKMIYFYMRAVSSANSFPAASTNLTNLLDRLAKEVLPSPPAITRHEKSSGLTNWLSAAFLHAHALGYKKKIDSMETVNNANSVWDKFCSVLSRNGHIFAGGERANLSLYLVNMVAVHVFMLESSDLASLATISSVTEPKPKSDIPKIYTRAAHSGPPTAHWLAFLLQASAKLAQTLVTILSNNLLSRDNQSEFAISESKFESVFASLLILLLWYRQSRNKKAFQNDVDNSMIHSACAVDSNVTEFLNQLQTKFHIGESETSPESIHLDQLSQLPELEHLQGFQHLTLPKSASPLVYQERADPVTESGSVDSPHSCQNVNELRIRAIVWCARQLPESVLSVSEDAERSTTKFVSVYQFVPSSPVTNENSHSVSPASRTQTKRNVAIESIMQNIPQRTPLVTSFAANPVTNVFHDHEPPIKSNETTIIKLTEQNIEADALKSNSPASNHQPGIIINADIAKFIHEQSSQLDGSKSLPVGVNSRPSNLSMPQAGGANKNFSNNSSSSGQSNTSQSQSLLASSKQLYNENREQFQRDLPPRFAAARGRLHPQHTGSHVEKRFHEDSPKLTSAANEDSFQKSSPSLPVPDLTKKETESPLPSDVCPQDCSPLPPTPPAFFFQDGGASPLNANLKTSGLPGSGAMMSAASVGRVGDTQMMSDMMSPHTTRADTLFPMNSLWSNIQTAPSNQYKRDELVSNLHSSSISEPLFQNHPSLMTQNAPAANSSRILTSDAPNYPMSRLPNVNHLKAENPPFHLANQSSVYPNMNQSPYQKSMPSSSGSLFDNSAGSNSNVWSFPLEHLLNQQLANKDTGMRPAVTSALPGRSGGGGPFPQFPHTTPNNDSTSSYINNKQPNALFNTPFNSLFSSIGQQSLSGNDNQMNLQADASSRSQYSWMSSLSSNEYQNFVQSSLAQGNMQLGGKLTGAAHNNNFSGGTSQMYPSNQFNSGDNILK